MMIVPDFEIKNVICQFFSPIPTPNTNANPEFKTTKSIYQWCCGILPDSGFNEMDVYEVMKELGFQIHNEQKQSLTWQIYTKKQQG